MGTFTQSQRKVIARNIRNYINEQFTEKERMQELARELGVSPATVSQWVKGRQTPQIAHLYQLSKVFNIPLDQLCGLHTHSSSTTTDLASNIIIKMASYENKKGKSLFHKIPRDKMPVTINLIFNELQDALDQS